MGYCHNGIGGQFSDANAEGTAPLTTGKTGKGGMLDEWLWTADGCFDDSWNHRFDLDSINKPHKKVTALWSRNAVTVFVTNFRNWPSIGSIPFCVFIVADFPASVKRCGAFQLKSFYSGFSIKSRKFCRIPFVESRIGWGKWGKEG